MINFPAPVSRLIRALNSAGHEAYAVGGCVRDALMGVTPNDWDITTSASPDEVKARFAGLRVIETGIRHGTVTVLENGVPYEITTYRRDGAYTDHRRPDSVQFVSELREDLMRRDFTINAMACHPDSGLIDLFGGREDLARRAIRCVGAPEQRFTEDALRILRALRFASTLDFNIEPETAGAAARLSNTLESVSVERVFEELKKLLCGRGAERVLLEHSDIIFEILPELRPMRDCPQNNPHHAYDVWTHTVKTVAAAPQDPVYRLAMLFHDSGKPAARTVGADGVDHFKGHPLISLQIARDALNRLKADKAAQRKVCMLVAEHDLRVSPKRVKRAMARLGASDMKALFPVLRADLRGQNPALRESKEDYVDALERAYDAAIAEGACVSVRDLAINGGDLMELGARGPMIGRLLEELLSLVVTDRLENERAALLEQARRSLG